jgi:type I restriction enzyme R subunit
MLIATGQLRECYGRESPIRGDRRYEIETPELIGSPQLFKRHAPARILVWRNVERHAPLPCSLEADAGRGVSLRRAGVLRAHRILAHAPALDFVLIEDSETKKSVLRQHQRRAI